MFTSVMRLPIDTLPVPPQSPTQVAAAVSVGEPIAVAVGVTAPLVDVGAWVAVRVLLGVEEATGVSVSVGDVVTVDDGAGVAVAVGI